MLTDTAPERGIMIPLTQQEGWVLVTLVAIIAISCLIWLALPKPKPEELSWFQRTCTALGMAEWPLVAAGLAFGLWLLLFAILLGGLLVGAVEVIANLFAPPGRDAIATRLPLITIATLTATLGAVVALPFTLIKRLHSDRQTRATEEGLITDRINAAVQGLGAEKEVSRIGRPVTILTGKPSEATHLVDDYKSFQLQPRSIETHKYRDISALPDGDVFDGLHVEIKTWPGERTVIEWQGTSLKVEDTEHISNRGNWQVFSETRPNLEVRVGAILALERLAKNNLDVHVQIMEILCAYIRQNAMAKDAVDIPEFEILPEDNDGPLGEDWKSRMDAYKADLRERLAKVEPRADIATALQVIGRRNAIQRQTEAEWGEGGKGAIFVFDIPCPEPPRKSEIDEIDRIDSINEYKTALTKWQEKLHDYRGYRLDLRSTNLQGAALARENLRGAIFGGSRMHGADLSGTRLEGASLVEVRMQGAVLRRAQMQGANLREVWMQGADLTAARMNIAIVWAAQMQGANLRGSLMQGAILFAAQMQGAKLQRTRAQGAYFRAARMQGAKLGKAVIDGARFDKSEFDAATSFSETSLRGSALRCVDLTNACLSTKQIQSIFGDGTVILPGGKEPDSEEWPEHWPKVSLYIEDFYNQWREWQCTLPGEPPEAA